MGKSAIVIGTSDTGGGGGGAGVDGVYTDVASATATPIGGAATVRANITGTTTITSFTNGTAGMYKEGKFAGVLTLTHNGTSLILPGGANIVTAAGDTFGAVTNDGTNWRVVWYERADGTPLFIGTIQGGTNPGALTLLDMLVTAASTIGTPHSWDMKIDAANIIRAYAESDGAGGLQNLSADLAGLRMTGTNTAGGTTGARTINAYCGSVNFAAAATSLVVTNNKVTTASLVFAHILTNDATAVLGNTSLAAGSFTLRMTGAPTGETRVGFLVINII